MRMPDETQGALFRVCDVMFKTFYIPGKTSSREDIINDHEPCASGGNGRHIFKSWPQECSHDIFHIGRNTFLIKGPFAFYIMLSTVASSIQVAVPYHVRVAQRWSRFRRSRFVVFCPLPTLAMGTGAPLTSTACYRDSKASLSEQIYDPGRIWTFPI